MIDNRREVPLIPLRGLTIFPYMVLHFDVGREKSIKALEEAMIRDQKIFLTTQKNIDVDLPDEDDFYRIGTVCRIKQMLKLPGDAIRVLVEGIARAEIIELVDREPYFKAIVEEHADGSDIIDKETKALLRATLDSFELYVNVNTKITPDVLITVSSIQDPGRFADVVASHINLKNEQKQEIVEAIHPKDRLEVIYKILIGEIEILEVEKKINDKVKSQINKLQKEYYLKEQMKVIREELGEDHSTDEEVDGFREKIVKLKIPKKIAEKLEKEIKRLSLLAPSSAESNVIRTYIESILDLPWNSATKDTLDLAKARNILNEDHYGLDFVKERVLEYLAVRQLTKSMKGPIICLVGPPGVGKTSIAKSIARSLNRKFIRMSLGGVRDEAEIRGHRRTYIGAIPGRIITNIKECKSKNPVFLFDEIDKVSSDFRGDPASALLEVLDPEQNKDFTDHYLEIPFDLSKVMFIATANSLNTVPRPLLDRMEIIQISGYTELEKVKIAEKYLIEKQMKENGIKTEQLQLSKDALKSIIASYTRESGVRELERQIGAVARKAAIKIVEEKKDVVRVNKGNLHKMLGVPKYSFDEIDKEDQVGVVTGLAWTSVGGDTLQIEVSIMKGKGKLSLTGQLGSVMKESAEAGFTYIRSRSKELGVPEGFYENFDVHLHVPEGAVPKDGPSAGITMATAMISAFTGKKVRKDVAMTGEITLRGRVLPIGGLKEKSLAAKRAGIKKILMPYDNKKDLEKIPEQVKKSIVFVPVKSMDEVIKHAILDDGDKNED